MLYGFLGAEQKYDNREFPACPAMHHKHSTGITIKEFSFSAGVVHSNAKEDDASTVFQKDGSTVVFSGKVYNAHDLREALGLDTICPEPEWIWQAFTKWGPEFVSKCNGDFSICIFHSITGTLFLFRDHLGIRPLVYCSTPAGFYFSGDERVLSQALFPAEPIQPDYLLNEIKLTSSLVTPNPKIIKLQAGHYLKYTQGQPEQRQYWFPSKIKVDKSIIFQQAVHDLHLLVADAVAIRCESGREAAVHLSGGLDSVLVALFVRKHYAQKTPFYGYSYSPSDSGSIPLTRDERQLVHMAGIAADITPEFTDLDISDYQRYAFDYYYNAGAIWDERICEKASQRGISLIFSGWGGDEFLSKSASGVYFDLVLGLHWKSLLQYKPPRSVEDFLKTIALHVVFPALGITWKKIGSKQKSLGNYLKGPYAKEDPKVKRLFYKYTTRRNQQEKTLESQYIPERCEKMYLQGLRHGVTYRFPLLDYRILEFVMKLPSRLFVGKGMNRMLSRQLLSEYVPEAVWKNTSKLDELVYKTWMNSLLGLSKVLIPLIPNWESNPDLHFVNFERLRKDVEVFSALPSPIADDHLSLLFNLQIINKMHEFSRVYRSPHAFKPE